MDRDHFWRRNNETGKLELVNCDTGLVVSPQEIAYKESILEANEDAPGFSEIMADKICQRLIEGDTITKIAKDPDYPDFYTISKWRKHHPEFDAAIKFAFQARADLHHDQVLETAQAIRSKDEAAAKKPLIDSLKWSAEKNNPEQYGQKTKISGDKNAPVQWIISTGVPDTEKDVTPKLELVEEKGDDKALPETGGTEVSGDTETEGTDS